ncbi:MAG: hypothetical protein NC311_20445, partial [Muribaculaceae bacterium]|nr:hypothetical protein [Muribaculaceae bacterium]
ILTMPDNASFSPIEPRGMAEIVNVDKVLSHYAASYPETKAVIKVTDPIIDDNNHIYFIDNGSCTRNDGFLGKLDLDVNIDVLTSILFSSKKVGMIFGLTTCRPFISLMLD